MQIRREWIVRFESGSDAIALQNVAYMIQEPQVGGRGRKIGRAGSSGQALAR
jgi:hypothetical protein